MLLFNIVKYITVGCFSLTLLFIAIAAVGLHLPKVSTKLRNEIFEIAVKLSFASCAVGSLTLIALPITYLIVVH